jgi:hypothetical protein
MKRVEPLVIACVLIAWAHSASGQDYRVRFDASAQSVSYRGLVSDSILATEAVNGPSGGLETADGHAVRCGAGDYCFFYRPGLALRGLPVSAAASLIMWGLGIQGYHFVQQGGSSAISAVMKPGPGQNLRGSSSKDSSNTSVLRLLHAPDVSWCLRDWNQSASTAPG